MKKKSEKPKSELVSKPEIKFESRFFWKELSDDGLLKEPRRSGPYYDEVYLNNYHGYESREDAFEDWKNLVKQGYYKYDEFILIEKVSLINEAFS
jgi:hypothetical protein